MSVRAAPRTVASPAVPRAIASAWPWIALALLLAVTGAFLYHETRGTTLWFDEWTWALTRRGGDLATFLRPHNEHLSLVPVAIYKLLLATAGAGDYRPYRVLVIACHLLVSTLVFVYGRRRAGDGLALGAAAIILLLGPAWQNFIWPFQIAWLISLASGLGALLLLDRGGRVADLGTCALLLVSIASSGIGVPVTAGVVVELLVSRAGWRRAWVVGVPFVLYGAWWLAYQHTQFHRHDLVLAPRYVAESAASAVSGLVGLAGTVDYSSYTSSGSLLVWGPPLAAVAAVALGWRLVRLRRLPARVISLLAMVLSFWALTAVSRAFLGRPFESRYLYVGGLLIVLIAIELVRGVGISPFARAVVIALGAAILAANWGALRDGGRFLRSQGTLTKAEIGALDMTRPILAPSFAVGPFGIIRADQYFAMERDVGSPAAGPAQIASDPEDVRLQVDSELSTIHGVAVAPDRRAPLAAAPPTLDAATGGTVRAHGGCLQFSPAPYLAAGAPRELDVVVPAGGLRLRATGGQTAIAVRRFAIEFHPIGTLSPSGGAVLAIAPDLATQPWHASITPAAGASVCALARS